MNPERFGAMSRGSMRWCVLMISLFLLASDSHALSIDSAATGAGKVLLSRRLAQADSLVKAQGGPRGDKALLFLTWNAPYGMRGARDTRAPSTRVGGIDTLYLAFMPGRRSDTFNGFTAELFFRAAPGDTLGTWWHMEKTGENPGALMAQFGPDPSFPQRQPWKGGGQGFVKLDRTPTANKLRMVFAVPDGGATLKPDSVYTLARVLLKHDRDLPGRTQPVCIEWGVAGLAFALKDEPQVKRGERFVGFGSADGNVCARYRARIEPWRPAVPGAKVIH